MEIPLTKLHTETRLQLLIASTPKIQKAAHRAHLDRSQVETCTARFEQLGMETGRQPVMPRQCSLLPPVTQLSDSEDDSGPVRVKKAVT